MTWKLYALASGGGLLATFLVSLAAPSAPQQAGRTNVPQVVSESGGSVDLSEQADRLRAGVAAATAYREPVRDAFRFGATARRATAQPVAPVVTAPPPVAPPVRPPFSLAGMASTIEGGVTQRTAILTSLHGVLFVKEGDAVDGGYRVVTIEEDAVTVEATSDGTRTTLRLAENQ